jgi:hypothetical protein
MFCEYVFEQGVPSRVIDVSVTCSVPVFPTLNLTTMDDESLTIVASSMDIFSCLDWDWRSTFPKAKTMPMSESEMRRINATDTAWLTPDIKNRGGLGRPGFIYITTTCPTALTGSLVMLFPSTIIVTFVPGFSAWHAGAVNAAVSPGFRL